MISEKLKEYRKKAGYNTVKAFTKELDIPYTTYLDYEKGLKEPSSKNIVKIADKLGISLDELLERVPQEARDGFIDVKKTEGGYLLSDFLSLESDNDKFMSEKTMQKILRKGEKLKNDYIDDCLRWYLHEHDEQQE